MSMRHSLDHSVNSSRTAEQLIVWTSRHRSHTFHDLVFHRRGPDDRARTQASQHSINFTFPMNGDHAEVGRPVGFQICPL